MRRFLRPCDDGLAVNARADVGAGKRQRLAKIETRREVTRRLLSRENLWSFSGCE